MKAKHQRSAPTLKQYLVAYKVNRRISSNITDIQNNLQGSFYRKIIELKNKIRASIHDKKVYAEIDSSLEDLYLMHKDMAIERSEQSRIEMRSLRSALSKTRLSAALLDSQNHLTNIIQPVLTRQGTSKKSRFSNASSLNCFDDNKENKPEAVNPFTPLTTYQESLKTRISPAIKRKKQVKFNVPQPPQTKFQQAKRCIKMQKKLFHKFSAE